MKQLMTKLKGVAMAALMAASGMAAFQALGENIEYLAPVYDAEIKPSRIETWETKTIDIDSENTINEYNAERFEVLNGGTYVCDGDASLSSMQISGNVNLILKDGVTLRINGPIKFNGGFSLTIYGQSGCTGRLIVESTDEECAAIHCARSSNLTINGGCVLATGKAGGINAESATTFRINGGKVMAHSTDESHYYKGIIGNVYIDAGTFDEWTMKYSTIVRKIDSDGGMETLDQNDYGYSFSRSMDFDYDTTCVYVNDPTSEVLLANNDNLAASDTLYKCEYDSYSEANSTLYTSEDNGQMSVLWGQTLYAKFSITESGKQDGWQFTDGTTTDHYQVFSATNSPLIVSAAIVQPPWTLTVGTADHTSLAVYTNDVEVAGESGEYEIERYQWATVVWTIVDDGYMFAGGATNYTAEFMLESDNMTITAPEVLVRPTSVSFTPAAVDHATAAVYTNGVALTADGGTYAIPFKATAYVVYAASSGYCFAGGKSVSTNELVTTSNPATMKGSAPAAFASVQVGDSAHAYVDGGVCTIYGTGATWAKDDWSDGNPLKAYAAAITNLVVESGITGLGANSFENMWYLQNVTLGADVTSVGDRAFKKCYGLTKVTSQATGASTVGDYAFSGCHSLETLSFAGDPTFGTQSYTLQAAIYMKDGGIPEVYAMPTVTIPNKVETILGKVTLNDDEWVDVTVKGDDERKAYHFFKIEMRGGK